jgi:pre-mRNA-processing factor 8
VTFVLPRNLLKRFISIADLRVQVAAFMYGTLAEGSDMVREVKCLVMAPQYGTHQNVTLPEHLPAHPLLDNLIPLGWIHTQAQEGRHLSIHDATAHAKLIGDHRWSPDTTVVTCAMTPGSVSLTSWTLTPTGFEWARQSDPTAWNDENSQCRPLLLTDRLRGFFLVPSTSVWNYAFQGVNHSPSAKYSLKLDTPLEFYHELHRASHFLAFSRLEDQSRGIEQEDHLA